MFLSRLGRGIGGEGPRAEGVGGGKPPFQGVLTRPTEGRRTLYAPRLPADPFARSAVSPQRNLLAAQSPCSAVSIIPSKPGRAPGVGQGPQKKGPGAQGRPGGPGGGARCARARADARFARGGPSGPWAPSGPRGPAYTQQKLCRTE